MVLKDLIEWLEGCDAGIVLPHGFHRPHSYRGFYDELAFVPAENVTIGSMLECAREALGKTYTGYKGGCYKMGEYTNVWLAEWGSTGEPISVATLEASLLIRKYHDMQSAFREIRRWIEAEDMPGEWTSRIYEVSGKMLDY